MQNPSNTQLLHAAQAGDPQATSSVLSLAAALALTRIDLDHLPPVLSRQDLLQVGRLAAAAALPVARSIEFLKRSALFAMWNTITTSQRRARLEAVPLDDLVGDQEPAAATLNPEDQLLEQERLELVQAALETISPRQRQVLNMALAGTRTRDIAHALGITRAACGAHLRAGVRAVQQYLARRHARPSIGATSLTAARSSSATRLLVVKG